MTKWDFSWPKVGIYSIYPEENNKSSGSGSAVHISTWIQLVRLIGPCCQRHPNPLSSSSNGTPQQSIYSVTIAAPEFDKYESYYLDTESTGLWYEYVSNFMFSHFSKKILSPIIAQVPDAKCTWEHFKPQRIQNFLLSMSFWQTKCFSFIFTNEKFAKNEK